METKSDNHHHILKIPKFLDDVSSSDDESTSELAILPVVTQTIHKSKTENAPACPKNICTEPQLNLVPSTQSKSSSIQQHSSKQEECASGHTPQSHQEIPQQLANSESDHVCMCSKICRKEDGLEIHVGREKCGALHSCDIYKAFPNTMIEEQDRDSNHSDQGLMGSNSMETHQQSGEAPYGRESVTPVTDRESTTQQSVNTTQENLDTTNSIGKKIDDIVKKYDASNSSDEYKSQRKHRQTNDDNHQIISAKKPKMKHTVPVQIRIKQMEHTIKHRTGETSAQNRRDVSPPQHCTSIAPATSTTFVDGVDIIASCTLCSTFNSVSHVTICPSGHPFCINCMVHMAQNAIVTGHSTPDHTFWNDQLICTKCFGSFTETSLTRNLPALLTEMMRQKHACGIPTSELSKSVSLNIDFDIPFHWESMANEQFLLVDLNRADAEFLLVARHFHQTVAYPLTQIHKIYRVQNIHEWNAYNLILRKMKSNAPSFTGKFHLNLWHGTHSDYAFSICKKGFDWRLNGSSTGTRYGKGSYFARDASYSKSYSDGKILTWKTSQFVQNTLPQCKYTTGEKLTSLTEYITRYPQDNKLNTWHSSLLNVNSKNIIHHHVTSQNVIQQRNITVGERQAMLNNTMESYPPINGLGATSSYYPRSIPREPAAQWQNIKRHLMFRVKVLVGTYTKGDPTISVPPPYNPDEPFGLCYDSCVDKMEDPNIYVTFQHGQSYPEYAIEYEDVEYPNDFTKYKTI